MKKNYILALSSVVFMSGCASILGETVDQKILFKGGDVRHFEFKKLQGTNESSIKNALISSFKKVSKVHKLHSYFNDSGNRVKQGLGVNTFGNDIKVTHHDSSGNLYDTRSAVYKVLVEEGENSYSVTVNCPSEFSDQSNIRGGIADTPYIPADLAVQNFNKICKDANPSIYSSLWIKGEFNSKYKSEDVFANFTRILSKTNNKEQVKGFDIEKAEIFKLPIKNDKKTNLALSVFPYRGGSKIVYAFKYNYKSNANAHSSYNESEINKAKQKITDIAND